MRENEGFKERFKKLRKHRKLSQTDLANALDVSKSLIGLYETGKREPSRDMQQKIADYFNVSLDYLEGREKGSIYYIDPEVAALAQELYDDPSRRILFDASRNLSTEDIQYVIDLIERLEKK